MDVVEDARIALLSRLIDHAPLFPPASLPLAEALDEDGRARRSSAAFVLGRFVSPAALLGELPELGRGVSAVLAAPVDPGVPVDAIELRLPDDPGALVGVAGLADEVYVEVSLDADLEQRLDRVAERGFAAKVRCGGVSAPSPHALARFLRACRERGLGFKATAGLHRAVRHDAEHGFLNLLAAVVFGDEEAALEETEVASFALTSASFSWGERSAGPSDLARARREVLHAIGSCSFFEPVAELRTLGMLPA